MIYKGISKVDGKTIVGTLMVEGLDTWIVDRYGRTKVWPNSVETFETPEGESE